MWPQDEPLLDQAKLESIRDLTEAEDDEDFLTSLIKMFFDRTPSLVQDIQQGISQSNGTVLERSAHSLKGTAGNIGAYPLMRVCEQLEERGRLRDFTDVSDLKVELNELYRATSEALRQTLHE
jgi:HPt (histidine-containing phosphotransfer) domain-containing protein